MTFEQLGVGGSLYLLNHSRNTSLHYIFESIGYGSKHVWIDETPNNAK